MLAVRDLSVSLAGRPVLTGIDFTIAPGEILGLIGESGSGKSMTALALLRLLPEGFAQTGRVTLQNQALHAQSERAMCRVRGNRVGMIFQEPMTALNPLQSIGRQVAETLRLHRGQTTRAARAEAAAVLARVGLPAGDFPLTLYPHQLSGGQRQRVGIAIAIACRPDLLIADEPTTALDVSTEAEILDLIRRLVAEDGLSVLFITHDLAVTSTMADRVAVMQAGRIVETGPVSRVLRAPQHSYTQALLDAARPGAAMKAAPTGDALIAVERLRRTYPGRRRHLFDRPPPLVAVDGVSFTLGKGERLGLVGASGSGKSTLTRALLGLEPRQGGTLCIDGTPVPASGAMPRALRAKIQVVFQDPSGSFNPRHKVARLIAEPFHLHPAPPKGPARARAVATALEAVGLRAGDADRYIHEFSGGQRQRIARARALILRPAALLLDEAVSALDVSVRGHILGLIDALAREHGLALLFISHALHVVRSVTSRVMVMSAGRIVEEGPTAEVLTRPQHAYTRALLAAAPRFEGP